MKYFLRWWLLFITISVGVAFMFIYDMFSVINKADFTKISFLIMGLFVVFTFKAGKYTYRYSQYPHFTWTDALGVIKTLEFAANAFFTLGMIGTVIGFICMLTCFSGIQANDLSALEPVISKMSTALFSTAAGLIASLLLRLQIFNLKQLVKAHECNF